MTYAQCEAIAAATPYQPKGVFYSEMFLFLELCERHHITRIFESGIHRGMSTRLLMAGFAGPITAIDRKPVSLGALPLRVRVLQDDAMTLLPQLLPQYRADRVAVLIDGPKGRAARRLRRLCLRAGAVLVAIHGVASDTGEALHSHGPAGAAYRPLDRYVSESYRAAYPDGPGLGIWIAA